MDLELIRKHIDQRSDEFIGWLQEAVRISSVTKVGEDPEPMLQWLEVRMSSLGISTQRVMVEGAHRLCSAPSRVLQIELFFSTTTTMLCLQGDLSLWESPPFDAVLKDGRVWGRGAADDKCSFVSRFAALAVAQELGELPLRVKFLIEGEEESGSPHFEEICLENRELLSADACAWECSSIVEGGRPLLYFGLKGALGVELKSRRLKRDMHSGSAGMFPSATWDLVHALATIRDVTGRVLIPGFYDDIVPLSAEEQTALNSRPMPTDEEAQSRKKNLGLTELLGNMSWSEGMRTSVAEPTANISGLSAGYVGEGFMTILPAEATAKTCCLT